MATGEPPGRSGPWNRTDWLISATLFFFTVLSRLPFRTSLLYAWDSVLYTRALENFDVTLHQPQPPGHIFYVGLLWLVNQAAGDANASMVWISIIASAAAVAALYWLGREMFNRWIGSLAALFLTTSLSFWGHGEIAYPYTLLAFLGIAVAGVIYKCWQGSSAFVLPSAIALGIVSGFRQDLLPFLLPLWIGGLIGKSRPLKAGATALLAASIAAWYIPSALLSGGFAAYREASSKQSSYIIDTASVFGKGPAALGVNLQMLGDFLLYALVGALPFLLYFLCRLMVGRSPGLIKDRRLLFLLVWIGPSVLFYVFLHIGEYGYVFTFLPPLLLFAAWGAIQLSGDLSRVLAGGRHQVRILIAVIMPVLVLNLLLFLVFTPHLSATRLADNEDIQRSRIDTIRANFAPGSTLVVSVFNFQQAKYYLPEYQHLYIDPVTADKTVEPLPAEVEAVVLFDESLKIADDAQKKSMPLAREQQLFYLVPAGESFLVVDWPARKVYYGR